MGLIRNGLDPLDGLDHEECQPLDDSEEEEERFAREILHLSGLQKRGCHEIEFYVPQLQAAEKEYLKLKNSRADQRAFVMERILLVKQIDEVNPFVPGRGNVLKLLAVL